MHFPSLQNGPINLFVSLRLIAFKQYFVYHSVCPNCLQFLRSKAEFFVPSTLVAAMFRKSDMLDRSKWRMTLFIHRNLPQEISIMILNTGQMCIVNYSGRPRMCDLKCPEWEKMRRRSGLQQTRGPRGPESLTWVYRPKVKHLTLKSEWPLTKVKEWPWPLILTQLH